MRPRNAKPGNKRRSLSDHAFETKKRAFEAVRAMRHDGLSLDAASADAGTTPATVKKYLSAALRRSKTGRWVATKSDRYTRFLSLPGPQGAVTVRARGSKEAEFASAYLASLARWTKTEKSDELCPFHDKVIDDFELVTDSVTLQALRDAGLLQLDSLYAALKDTV